MNKLKRGFLVIADDRQNHSSVRSPRVAHYLIHDEKHVLYDTIRMFFSDGSVYIYNNFIEDKLQTGYSKEEHNPGIKNYRTRPDHNTGNFVPYSLRKCVGSLTSPADPNTREDTRDGTYGLIRYEIDKRILIVAILPLGFVRMRHGCVESGSQWLYPISSPSRHR